MQAIGDLATSPKVFGKSSIFTEPHPGKDASPEAIVQWADRQTAAHFARLGIEVQPPANQCPACQGKGYTGTGDTSAWCTAPGCTLGRSSRTCLICGNVAHNRREFEIPCTCSDTDKAARDRLTRSGTPAKYHGWTFKSWWTTVTNFQPQAVHDVYTDAGKLARIIADGDRPEDGRPGLLVLGATGRGKSGLAAAIADAWTHRGAGDVRWIAWAGWCDTLNALRNAGGDDVGERKKAARAPLLIIDDLGSDELSTSYRQRVLLDLLEIRSPELPTIITAMYGLTELSTRFGEASIGRLIETCTPVTLTGVDTRRAQRKESTP